METRSGARRFHRARVRCTTILPCTGSGSTADDIIVIREMRQQRDTTLYTYRQQRDTTLHTYRQLCMRLLHLPATLDLNQCWCYVPRIYHQRL